MPTIRPGDKYCLLAQAAFMDCPAYEHFAMAVHRNNLDEFLEEHGVELDADQLELARRDGTAILAMFASDKPGAELGFVMLAPPSLRDAKCVPLNTQVLDPRAYPSLIVNLYT